jgi:hypothetical protein
MDCLFGDHEAPQPDTVPYPDPCAASPDATRDASPKDLFVASGISGGSFGLVEWDAHLASPGDASWVQDRLGADYVSSSLARGLLVEVPRSFLQFHARGRDDVLEQAWEAQWNETGGYNPLRDGFLKTQYKRFGQGGPFLFINGSSVLDGCSLNVSLLDVGSTVDQVPGNADATHGLGLGDCNNIARYPPASTPSPTPSPSPTTGPTREPPGPLPGAADLVDYLGCKSTQLDVRRSTAALLSARFPFVSGTGRLSACGVKETTKYILDGGLVDDSGAESALAIWQAIEPAVDGHNATDASSCIIPYYVQLDNGYVSSAPPATGRAPNQLLAPLQGAIETNGLNSRAARAQAMAAVVFQRPFPLTGLDPATIGESVPEGVDVSDRYRIIVPKAHPGTEASLGWTLSSASRRDLERQLYDVNGQAIRDVRGWLSNPPACPSLSGGQP